MHHQKGFTLLELMIAVAIIGILAAIATPSFTNVIRNNRIATQTNQVLGTLQLARSEAIARHAVTRVCGSTDATNTTFPKSCNTASWELGVIAFSDVDGNGTASADELIKSIPPLGNGNTLRGVASAGASIAFGREGTVSAATTLRLCDSRGAADSRQIAVNLIGQASSGANATCP